MIIVWIAAGLLALAGALTYAELTTMRPHAGAEYVITKDAYGRVWGFLNGWSQFLISRTASAAALAVGFAIFMNDLTRGRLDVVYFTFQFPSLESRLQFGHYPGNSADHSCGHYTHQLSRRGRHRTYRLLRHDSESYCRAWASASQLSFIRMAVGANFGMANVRGTCEDVTVTGAGFAWLSPQRCWVRFGPTMVGTTFPTWRAR